MIVLYTEYCSFMANTNSINFCEMFIALLLALDFSNFVSNRTVRVDARSRSDTRTAI